MQPSNKAIIIAANPFKEYGVAPGRTTKELGNVKFHREHLNRYGFDEVWKDIQADLSDRDYVETLVQRIKNKIISIEKDHIKT
ncbi:MAG: hypothetical protein QW090_04850 [Candidatus Bathyarchaeia archaeon]